MPVHPNGCECDSYGCRLRRKGLDVLPSATPSRTQNRKQPHRPMRQPSWEKGRVTESRPDGKKMPVLNAKGRPMSVHEADNSSARIRSGLRAAKQGVT